MSILWSELAAVKTCSRSNPGMENRQVYMMMVSYDPDRTAVTIVKTGNEVVKSIACDK